MTALLWIVAAAAVIVLTALVLPVRVYARASGGTDDGFAFTANVRPWGGAVGFGLSSDKRRYHAHVLVAGRSIVSVDVTRSTKWTVKTANAKVKAKPKPKKKQTDDRSLIDRIKSGLTSAKQYKQIALNAAASVLRIVNIDRLSVNVTLGLLNPAATGQTAAILYTLNGLLPRHCVIIPSFDFTREVLSGTLAVEIRISTVVFWKEVFTHIPVAIAYARGRRKESATVLTQEV
jgi:hypothetical protein